MKRVTSFLVVFMFVLPMLATAGLVKADSLYESRGNGFNQETLLADSTLINKAIAAYTSVLESADDKSREDVLWKLMRAYYFKGHYCTHDKELKKKYFSQGIDLSESGLEAFPESIGINLWTSVLWGMWGDAYGKIAAAKKGVAGKIREHAKKVIELDETYFDAAGYRVLGRLHFKAPKIPFILGWPSKKKAVELLEKAYKIAPDHIVHTKYLAEALYVRNEKDRAVELMNKVLQMGDKEGVVEAAVARAEAKALLEEWAE